MILGFISSFLVRIGLKAPAEEPEVIIEDNLHLLETGDKHDTVLRCYDKTFHVHKPILTKHSDVFQVLFDSRDDGKNVFSLEDIGPGPLKQMLHYLYSGNIPNLDIHHTLKLLDAAESYAVSPLKKKCLKIVKQGLKDDDICEVLVFADKKVNGRMKMPELKDIVIGYLVERKDYLQSEVWKAFSDTHTKLANEVLTAFVRKTGK